MKTKSEFYLKKLQNEKKLIEEEYKIKDEFSTLITGKELLSNLLKLPFQSKSKEPTPALEKNAHQSSNNLIQNGIQLVRTIKEITMLSKNIFHQLKP